MKLLCTIALLASLGAGPGNLIRDGGGRSFRSPTAPSAPPRLVVGGVNSGGTQGIIATSDDNGASWTSRTAPAAPARYLSGAYFKGTWFLASTGHLSSSADNGVTWSDDTTHVPSDNDAGQIATDGNALFVSTGAAALWKTTDGSAWAQVTPDTKLNVYGVTWSKNLGFIVTGIRSDTAFPGTKESLNGTTWTNLTNISTWINGSVCRTPLASDTTAIVFNGSDNHLAQSTDATNWNLFSSPWFSEAGAGCWNGTVFAYGQIYTSGSANVWTSTDGTSFTARTPPAGTYYGVGCGAKGRLIAVGSSKIAYSDDNGASWVASTGVPAGLWNCLAHQ